MKKLVILAVGVCFIFAAYSNNRGANTIPGSPTIVNTPISVKTRYKTLNHHAIDDLSILDIDKDDSVNGYSSFDANPTLNAEADVNHFNSYQARPIFQPV